MSLGNTVLIKVNFLPADGVGREETPFLDASVAQRFNSFHLQLNDCLSIKKKRKEKNLSRTRVVSRVRI